MEKHHWRGYSVYKIYFFLSSMFGFDLLVLWDIWIEFICNSSLDWLFEIGSWVCDMMAGCLIGLACLDIFFLWHDLKYGYRILYDATSSLCSLGSYYMLVWWNSRYWFFKCYVPRWQSKIRFFEPCWTGLRLLE